MEMEQWFFFSSASSSSVSVFSVFLLLFLTVQGLLPMTGRTVTACCWRRCFQRRRERPENGLDGGRPFFFFSVFFFCALFSSVSVFQCFLFSPLLSAFLSVTALLSFSKILPLFLFSLPLLFISRKRRCPPTLSHRGAGGKRAALPLQGKVVGRVCTAWCPSLLLSRWQGMVVWVLAGYGCVQVEGRESEREKHFQKSFSSLPLHAQGRRSCIVQVFFFKKKEKE
jgi:hypothetical protein